MNIDQPPQQETGSADTPKQTPEAVPEVNMEEASAKIAGVTSPEELKVVLSEVGGLQSEVGKFYPADKLNGKIDGVVQLVAATNSIDDLQIILDTITSAGGLKQKVTELAEALFAAKK